jgi:hypothetical protein
MIDMAKMICESFSATELERHIFDDAGGNSRSMLKHILQPGSVIVASSLELIADNLGKFGPGLVATFEVHEDFNASYLSYDGNPRGKLVGHHAMVLVGSRREAGSGKQWFLLQNWWPQMQFAEVSEEYMEACGATVYFVKTPQTAIPTQFPVTADTYAENENLDKPETFAQLEW